MVMSLHIILRRIQVTAKHLSMDDTVMLYEYTEIVLDNKETFWRESHLLILQYHVHEFVGGATSTRDCLDFWFFSSLSSISTPLFARLHSDVVTSRKSLQVWFHNNNLTIQGNI